MATSKGPIGKNGRQLLHVDSAVNLTVTKENVPLAPDELKMLTIPRLDRGFMTFIRVHYPGASKKHVNTAVISPDDNAPDSNSDEE